jgi:hypothetical protein
MAAQLRFTSYTRHVVKGQRQLALLFGLHDCLSLVRWFAIADRDLVQLWLLFADSAMEDGRATAKV